MKEEKVKLQIWDTAGMEQHRAIVKSYFRGAIGAFLVCDITNLQSFYNLEYWVKLAKEDCDEDVVIGLFANKTDIMFESP
jgi:small GTP-binding protein